MHFDKAGCLVSKCRPSEQVAITFSFSTIFLFVVVVFVFFLQKIELNNKKARLPHVPFRIQLFRQRLSKKSLKAYTTMPKGSLGNSQ